MIDEIVLWDEIVVWEVDDLVVRLRERGYDFKSNFSRDRDETITKVTLELIGRLD